MIIQNHYKIFIVNFKVKTISIIKIVVLFNKSVDNSLLAQKESIKIEFFATVTELLGQPNININT